MITGGRGGQEGPKYDYVIFECSLKRNQFLEKIRKDKKKYEANYAKEIEGKTYFKGSMERSWHL